MSDLKKLWVYIRPFKGSIFLVILMGLIMSGSIVATVPFVKMLFDDVFTQKNEDLKYIVPAAFVFLYFIHGTARYFHMYILKMAGERLIASIRLDLQQKFMRLNLTFHGKYEAGSGGLLSRILNDMVVVQWGLQLLADIVREPITVIGLLIGMFYLDWQLTASIMVIAPVIAWILKQLARSIRKYSHHQQTSMEDITSVLKETLDGVRVIQSFNLEKEMGKRLDSKLKDYLSHRSKIIAREEFAGPISEFIGSIVFGLICVYMADQIIGGQSSTGTFLSFIAALGQFQPPIKKLQDAYIRLQQTIAATNRLFEILEDTNEVPQSKSHKTFPKSFAEVRFDNVTFAYNERPTLKNINLTVKRGEVIALVGESGSGKSTLVNLLGRFFDPTNGKILIGDTPIDEIELKDLRKHIALVTQDVFLFNESIERNIQAGDFDRTGGSAQDSAKSANAYEFIMNTEKGFDTPAGDRGARLSGGERQRISIARALYKDAPILILDEATSALDSASEVEVQKGLDRLMKGRTVFVIAHRLSTVVNADRILVLKDGQIVEQGRHQDLLDKAGSYANFYRLQTMR